MTGTSEAPSLTVLILTKDETENLPTTLESLAGLGAEVVVVDSGSTDGTVELARRAGCRVVHHDFTTQADQVNWAIEHLGIETTWILRLDADERMTPELVTELRTRLVAAPEDVTGFEVKRRVYFWGSWIRYGGYYPTWLFRVWRNGSARSEQRWMDEHMVSSGGRIDRLANDIIDENRKGLTFWIQKHNSYSIREVRDILEARAAAASAGVTGQAGRRRWLKTNVYARSPLFLRAFLYFGLRYFLRLGFLDGIPGLVFHFNQCLWYRLLVDARIYEARLLERNRR